MSSGPWRPYDPEMAKEICEIIANSPDGLDKILASDKRFPCNAVFYRWRAENEDFARIYVQAKQNQLDCLVNQVLAKGLDKSDDQIIQPDGRITPNSASVQRDRLYADTVKWYASKLAPRLYGDRQIVEQHTTHSLHEKDLAELEQVKKVYKKDL